MLIMSYTPRDTYIKYYLRHKQKQPAASSHYCKTTRRKHAFWYLSATFGQCFFSTIWCYMVENGNTSRGDYVRCLIFSFWNRAAVGWLVEAIPYVWIAFDWKELLLFLSTLHPEGIDKMQPQPLHCTTKECKRPRAQQATHAQFPIVTITFPSDVRDDGRKHEGK